jgi:arsenate reductase
VSAAFNPVVTLVERALGAVTTSAAAVLIGAQLVGGLVGAVVANLMFDLPAVEVSAHARTGVGLWLGEVVATLGLVVVIFGVVRSGRGSLVAFAVGGYITAAYWFTSSTSFANPAVTTARMFSDTFAGIAPPRSRCSSSCSCSVVLSPTGSCACCTRRPKPSPPSWPAEPQDRLITRSQP